MGGLDQRNKKETPLDLLAPCEVTLWCVLGWGPAELPRGWSVWSKICVLSFWRGHRKKWADQSCFLPSSRLSFFSRSCPLLQGQAQYSCFLADTFVSSSLFLYLVLFLCFSLSNLSFAPSCFLARALHSVWERFRLYRVCACCFCPCLFFPSPFCPFLFCFSFFPFFC